MLSRTGSRRRSTASRSSAASSRFRPRPTSGARSGAASASPAVERLAGPLDVFHFSDWMYPRQRAGAALDDRPRPDPAALPGVGAPADAPAEPREVPHAARTCDVIVTISAFTADDIAERLGFPRERIVVAYPGVDERFTPPDGPAARTADYVLMLAPDDPRKNYGEPRRGGRARPLAGLSCVCGAGPRAGRRAARPLSRRRRLRLPVLLRGLRDPGPRGDGERHARRRFLASVAGRGLRRRGRARRPEEPRGDRGGHRARARRSGTASSRRASSTRGASPGARAARPTFTDSSQLPETLPAVLRVGLDVSPLALTKAGTARYLTNLLEGARATTLRSRSARYSFGGPRPADEGRAGHRSGTR